VFAKVYEQASQLVVFATSVLKGTFTLIAVLCILAVQWLASSTQGSRLTRFARNWTIPKTSLLLTSISLFGTAVGLWFIIANYNINARADRPIVIVTRAEISGTADPDTYTITVALWNSGKEDARQIIVRSGMIDPTATETKSLVSQVLSRLVPSIPPYVYPVKFDIHKTNALKFFVLRVTYTDSWSRHFEPAIIFSLFPGWPASNATYEFQNP
jgi:hypothetical protein